MNSDPSSRPALGLQRFLELTATILLGFVLSLLMTFFLLDSGKIDRLASYAPCRLLYASASFQWCDSDERAMEVCADVQDATAYLESKLISAVASCTPSQHSVPLFSVDDDTRFAVSGGFQKVSAHLFADSLRTLHLANRKKLMLNKSTT